MYKNFTKRLGWHYQPILKFLFILSAAYRSLDETGKRKWMMRIKFTTFLIIAAFVQVSATGFAQRLTFSRNNTTLKKVFAEIENQTSYDVVYLNSKLNDQERINVNFKNASLEEVLEYCLKNYRVSYTIEDKTIVLQEKSASVLDKLADFFKTTEISGRVLDADGKPISAVNIKVKGSKKVVVADAEGRFNISVAEGNAILIFSSVGYVTKEVAATQGMTVSLEPELNKLNEMVVVGYGSTRRKDLTGSVASVDVNEVKNVPFATLDQALTGKAAGVQVVQADGSPGGVAKIRIRGGTSLLGGNDPLYIIDGIQVQIQNRYLQSANGVDLKSPIESSGSDRSSNTISGAFARGLNSLGGLNISDIESIDILKDASATAIYGSRAANGVVIITTKKGKLNQKPIFEVNYYTGMSKPIKEKLLNRDQYIMIMKEGAQNLNDMLASLSRPADADATKILTDPNFLGTGNTDWLGLILRNGITQNADISVRGGGSGSRFYTSLAYNKNNGVVLGTDYTRIAGKVSLDNEINSKLRINTNLDYGFSTNNISNGLYSQALLAPPTINPYNTDGSIIRDYSKYGVSSVAGFQNPLLLVDGINRSNNVSLIGSLAAEYSILKDLKFRSNVSVNYNNYRQNNYIPSTVQYVDSKNSFPANSNNGIATQGTSQTVDVFYENNLTWDKHFNENNRLTLLAGTSWQKNKSNSFSASGQGFPDDVYLNNLSSAAVTLPSTGVSGQNSLLSFYMRANYTLFEKYLFTFTGRSDASSKFPEANRVGYFPSGGIAWRISQENFLKSVKWIDEIKLRASAGYTGTQNIGDYLFYTLYSPVSYAGLNGMKPTQLGNDQIKWESTLQKDAGIDFSFFKSRLSGGIGYYEKSTTGVLFPATVASSSGFGSVTANIADIRNRGIELTIRGEFIQNKDFQWSGTFNVSGNRSKVLALSNDFSDPNNPQVYRYGNTALRVGQPLGLIYGSVFDGIIKNQEEADYYRNNYWIGAYGSLDLVGVGDPKYVLGPIDNLGRSALKQDIIGNAEPKFYGGYTNSLSYRNFTLTTLATFSYGGDIIYMVDAQNYDLRFRSNKTISILDRWTPENSASTKPRVILGRENNARVASNNVYDATYLKLKTITLNYQLPKLLMDRLKINNASVYISATNLFTITHYPGADPEISNDPYSVIGGYSDIGGYPTVKQFSLGLRFGF